MRKLEAMIKHHDFFGTKPNTFREAILDKSPMSFHENHEDQSAAIFINGNMSLVRAPHWAKMKKTINYFMANPLEYDEEEVMKMVKKSIATGNSKGRGIEDAC